MLKEEGKKAQTKSYMWLYRTGKAVIYAKNQQKYVENYLLDGRCAISNNAAENVIRPFTIGRKNWLFTDTPKGATASATIYSIIETAKANKINIFTYLEYLLLYMQDTDWRNHPCLGLKLSRLNASNNIFY